MTSRRRDETLVCLATPSEEQTNETNLHAPYLLTTIENWWRATAAPAGVFIIFTHYAPVYLISI